MDINDKTELYLFRMWQIDGISLKKNFDLQPLQDWLSDNIGEANSEIVWNTMDFPSVFSANPSAISVWVRGHHNAVLFKLRWHDDITFHVLNNELKMNK